jgi:hypothetical protein
VCVCVCVCVCLFFLVYAQTVVIAAAQSSRISAADALKHDDSASCGVANAVMFLRTKPPAAPHVCPGTGL